MPLPKIPKGLRRRQLERLKFHIEQDPVLYSCFHTIVSKPTLAPENNPSGLPTLAIYVVRENMGFATTESYGRPGLFTMALLYSEANIEETQLTPDDIYANLLDVSELLMLKLYSLRGLQRDPENLVKPLWHAIVFGGDQKGAREGHIHVGPYALGYERESGVKQIGIITFALFSNQDK